MDILRKFLKKGKDDSIDISDIIQKIDDVEDRNIEDIMVPRVDIVSVNYTTSIESLIDTMKKHNHSRVPVFENRIDNIIGVAYIEDILKLWGVDGNFCVAEIMKLPHFLPASNGIFETIEYFRKERISLSFVVDEYGTVVGLITMEDLLEALVGEIEDEFAIPEMEIEKDEDGYLILTSIEIDRLNEELDTDFPEDEEYNTLGGLIYTQLERIPHMGEKFVINGYEFKVVESTSQHVKKVFMKNKEKNE